MNPRLLLGLPVVLLLVLNWLPGLDQAAADYLDNSLADSLVIYASARGLNGVISVLQSVQFSVSLGAGVGINLGEALDPLNDLIERFSSFVLYGLAAIGLQKLVLAATSSLVMKVLATVVVIAGYLVWAFREQFDHIRWQWLIRAALILVLVRFFLLVELGTVSMLDHIYFDQQKQHATSALELAREELGELHQKTMAGISEGGLMGGVREATGLLFGNPSSEGVADLAAGAIVELIVIMLVRAIIMPLLFLWILLTLMKHLAGMPLNQRISPAPAVPPTTVS